MDEKQRGIIIGSLIILIGFLILSANLDFLNISGDISVGGIFLLLGITLISFYFNNTQKLAPLFTGEILCIIGAAVVFQSLRMIPYYYRENLSWTVILFGSGFIFLTGLLTRRKATWSLIPAGFFFSLGVMLAIKTFTWLETSELWVVFLTGLSLSLFIFYLLSKNQNRTEWAKNLSMILLLLAAFILYQTNDQNMITRIAFPVLLILFGGYFIFRSLKVHDYHSIS